MLNEGKMKSEPQMKKEKVKQTRQEEKLSLTDCINTLGEQNTDRQATNFSFHSLYLNSLCRCNPGRAKTTNSVSSQTYTQKRQQPRRVPAKVEAQQRNQNQEKEKSRSNSQKPEEQLFLDLNRVVL